MSNKHYLLLALLFVMGTCSPVSCEHGVIQQPPRTTYLTSQPETFPCQLIESSPPSEQESCSNQKTTGSQTPPLEACLGENVRQNENQNNHRCEEYRSPRSWSYSGEKHETEERTDEEGCLHLRHRWVDNQNRKHETQTWTDVAGDSYEVCKWEDGDGCVDEVHQIVDASGHTDTNHCRRDQHGVVTNVDSSSCPDNEAQVSSP